MPGYINNFVKVNLSNASVEVFHVGNETLRNFLGGRGLGIRLLWDFAPQNVDPFSPINPLIFVTGPYTGTGVFSAYYNATTLSPLTGTAASAHSGGSFGPALKKAGFDGLVVIGKAEKPVYLLLNNGKVEIKDAGSLWGLDVVKTEEALKAEHGRVTSAVIGTAGENLIRFGCIMNDTHRALGRGGTGAVMGSKNLKAVAAKGNMKITYHDYDRFTALSRKGGKIASKNGQAFAKYGTTMAFGFFALKGTMPSYHFRKGYFDDWEKIGPEVLKERYFVRDSGCFKCPLRCANIHRVESGPFAVDETEGPEYETMMSFGTLCGINEPEAIIKANHLVNLLGMDSISAGVVVAFAMDLFDLGILSAKDTGGLDLRFGNAQAMLDLIRQIAKREGLGDLLAEGSLRAARKIGRLAEQRVMTCLGQELPGYEPRRAPGTGFSLASSSRGADHLRATFYVNEIFAGEFKDKDYADHLDVLLAREHLMVLADSLAMCKFGQRMGGFDPEVTGELLTALTGLEWTGQELMVLGERVYNLERLFNIGKGFREITLPNRCFTEPLEDSLGKVPPIDTKHFAKARRNYFQARGWDESGQPGPKKLEELSLTEFAV